jgi:hypothetical protein
MVRASVSAVELRSPQMSHEIAAAMTLAGRNVDPRPLQEAFQNFEKAMTATSEKEALFQRKEIQRTPKHLIEPVSALAQTFSELN